MSRSGYSNEFGDDFNNQMELYRNTVHQAIKGKRGQAFLHELLEALDALPEKRLISESLVTSEGECCALGAIYLKRGISCKERDADADMAAKELGIAHCLAAEIVYQNDEGLYGRDITPEKRWEYIHAWVTRLLAGEWQG